jgi:hypothetical protein
VCYIDHVHGCGVFLGDISGVVSFYKVGASSNSVSPVPTVTVESPELQLPPPPLSTSQLLTPVIVGQQSLYSTRFQSSTRRDHNQDFRLLDMKVNYNYYFIVWTLVNLIIRHFHGLNYSSVVLDKRIL